MIDQAARPGDDHFDIRDVEPRIKAIFIGSIGNLVEWYDFNSTMRDTKHESAMHRHE